MKISLKLLSYTVLILAIVLGSPLSESIKIKNTELEKKIITKLKAEAGITEDVSESTEESVEEKEDEGELEEELDTIIVKKVIDGDTIVLEDGRKVRLIGINAPEKYQKFGLESTLKTKELTLEKEVILEYDKDKEDDYGRTLAYVYTEEIFVNYELLKGGFAYLMTIPPNTKYLEEFKKVYQEAKANKLGIWKGK